MSKTIRLLYVESDKAALQPVLEQLAAKGVRVKESGEPGKNDIVLAALSEAFYADSGKTEQLLSLIGAGAENVLPLQIDGAAVPEKLKNALYARNITPGAERDAAQIAERVIAALPQKKSRLPLLLGAAGIVLLAVIGMIIWNTSRSKAPEPIVTEEPAEEDVILLPAGLTEEDLAEIVNVTIVGEQAEFYTAADVRKLGGHIDWDHFAYRDYDNEGAHWYSREDGHEYSMTRYEDLRFLQLMPNLRDLTLAVVDVGRLPQLGELTKLDKLMLADSRISDLEWVEGAPIKKIDLLNSTGSITDFGALTSCEKLREVHLDLINTRQADLSGFAPSKLDWFWINNAYDLQNALDLSGLRSSASLHEVQLDYIPITDLSFLDQAAVLNKLRLEGLDRLRDISALSGLKNLSELEIRNCSVLRDYSAVAGCEALTRFSLDTDGNNRLRDASFLNGLTKLNSIQLGGVDLANLDFLKELSQSRSVMDHFSFWGTIGDYSGLASMKTYRWLSLDPDSGTSLSEILPWLEGVTIQELALRRFAEVDFSALPKVNNQLELDRCGITDLSTMPENFATMRLNLNKCSSLLSLDGLQNNSRFGKNKNGDLNIYYCPRLIDWSALDGMSLNKLSISGGYTLPDFSNLRTGELSLDSVADVTDLDFLNEMDNTYSCNFKLVGMDGLNNLKPLERFLGSWLAVSPQLAEQAQDLVNAGRFREYRIEYPEGGWEQDDLEMSLLSLDELETLPPALLRRVTKLCIVGDQVLDLNNADIWENWNNSDMPELLLHSWATDEVTPIKYRQGIVTDLSMFSELTGLRELRLYDQPLESLDGIQQFAELRHLEVRFCRNLRDASPAFTLQNLHSLCLNGSAVESIQGIQNLNGLCELDINNTKVQDLSPLGDCDFSASVREWGGFALHVNGIVFDDYSALAAIPAFGNLDINDVDPLQYLPFLEGKEVYRYFACNAFNDRTAAEDPNALFADFVRSHPELKELGIPWNQGITDLTPLLELENLERVRVSYDMKEAIASLGGQELPFEWEVDGQ